MKYPIHDKIWMPCIQTINFLIEKNTTFNDIFTYYVYKLQNVDM